jgi:hypothetical protein
MIGIGVGAGSSSPLGGITEKCPIVLTLGTKTTPLPINNADRGTGQ